MSPGTDPLGAAAGGGGARAVMAAAVVLLLGSVWTASAESWPFPEARVRLRLEPETENGVSPEAGTARLFFPRETEGGEIRVVTETGVPVGHEMLWTAAGEPATILFDCSGGERAYMAYLLPEPSDTPPDWRCPAGLVLETRHYDPARDGGWTDPRTLWSRPARVFGRSLVPEIHHGVHLHGPTRSFASHYRGVLNVTNAGEYGFAVVSHGVSHLLINGRVVAVRTGESGGDPGRRARHRGRVRLNPGRHRIDVYNVQDSTPFTISAAWRPPGRKDFTVIPRGAFAQAVRFRTTALETRPGLPRSAGFRWETVGHCLVDDMALVTVRFHLMGASPADGVVWTFDDGTRAEGPDVERVFPASGPRTVSVEIRDGLHRIAALERSVLVHPRWGQIPDWPDSLFAKQRAELMRRDLAAMPVSDLVALTRLAERIEDRPMQEFLGGACLTRHHEFDAAAWDVFYRLGFLYQHFRIRRYDLAERAFRLAAASGGNGAGGGEAAMLHLAGLLIHGMERIEEAQRILTSLDEERLSADDVRLKRIFEGDAWLSRGQAEAARRAYAAVGIVNGSDAAGQALRRRARLETAGDYVRRAEYDAAERLIREIEWEAPLERLNAETGLVMVRCHLGRREFAFAAAHCRRLLQAAPMDARTPDILFRLVQACLGLGRPEQARAALRRLLEEYPYSEAAARAKDQWGSSLSEKK